MNQSPWIVATRVGPNRLGVFALVSVLGLTVLTIPCETKCAESECPTTEPRAVSLRVSPAEVRVGGTNPRQQLLITAEDETGRPFDVTHRCRLEIQDSKLATVDGTVIAGLRDGATTLTARFADVEAQASVVVKDVEEYPPVHFVNDVMPLFSKFGCNSGGCHGKQSGQNGFKLSVFGFDPRADYDALVKEGRGRRTFPGDPSRSLLTSKPTGRVAHGGGQRMSPDSADASVLAEWIGQGMPWGDDNAPRVTHLEIEPAERLMKMQSTQQVLVTAVFADGKRRDVTSAASYSSNAEMVAGVERPGLIQTGQLPGEAAITINYMGHVGAVRLIVPKLGVAENFPALVGSNQIDELVWAKLRKLNIVPSVPADDATLMRRMYLHAIGTLPTANEVREFLADADPHKRRRLIDQVLAREEYADYWALKWADVLLVDQETLGGRGAYEFHRWLREQMAANRPYDEWVRELITASGNSGKYGPVNFYRAMRTPEDLTKSVSQALLGIRMDCAQCHHHPFEKWAQEDFYGMAGFFNGLERKDLSGGRELVFHAQYRESKMPLTGVAVQTRPPGGPLLENSDDADPRVQLADWITRADNPYFARLAANRLWKHFLGRGLVEPEDDLRSTNPATNEPLLEFLAQYLVEKEFDLQALMRLIMNSRVYQLSSEPNDSNFDDEQNYSHFLVRRLPAEVMLDAISQATGSPERFVGMPHGTRAIQLWDNRMPSYFLDTFGRSERQSPCECGKSGEPTMAQALHLMNAPEIDAKIADTNARVARLVGTEKPRDVIVEELCLAVLSRPAGEKEKRIAEKLFAGADQRAAAEDFLWMLLNSYDFLFVK